MNKKFELNQYHRNVPNENLIQDVREVAIKTGRDTVTMDEYQRFGMYHPSTLQRRFGSWFNVLKKAGLQLSRSKLNISDEELFDNLRKVWITLGRQPKYQEVKTPLSLYCAGTYENRFGSWRKALEAFVSYINDNTSEDEGGKTPAFQNNHCFERNGNSTQRKTKREISHRLRFKILLRDGFCCLSCGRSPIKSPGVELHIDHIIPWSKGGETIPENLQTKCKECNLGKGNAFSQ